MEEVDNIIIHSLRKIDCDIDESITTLASFDTELVVKATVKCLQIMKPDLGLSPVLPANMAQRFRMGATLAQICSDLGYRGDIGYQTFLYSAEADLRRVLMFLIEKLPKESNTVISKPDTKSAQLEKLISSAVLQQISVPWLPYYCYKRRTKFSVRMRTPFKTVNLDASPMENSEEYHSYNVRYKASLLDQVPEVKYLVPSIISLNSRNKEVAASTVTEKIDWLNSQEYDKAADPVEEEPYLISKFISGMNLKGAARQLSENADANESEDQRQSSPESGKSEKNTKGQQELDRLKSECEDLKVTIEETQQEIKKLMAEINQATLMQENESKALAIYEEESKVTMKAYELLENGEENLVKLEETIEAYVNKLVNLASQWEKRRFPLIEQYRNLKENICTTGNANQQKLEEIQAMKEKEKELIEECRCKDQQYAQLLADVQKQSKEVSRSAYTQRILEIINNIKKQKDEIEKVLGDTREVQKDINMLTGKLERSFAVVDELIFRDARTNETSRRAYKLLATLHSDCSEIVALVEETGAIVREIRDLEEQIESESAKNIGANLERITADLKQMRQETANLTAQLESKKS